jgi:chromosome partitioning protein
MTRTAFHIQKGGVGKTTLAGSVAYCSAGERTTVMVDCDPQGNLSSWYLDEVSPPRELADALRGDCLVRDAMVEVRPQLWLLPTFGLDGTLKAYGETQLMQEPHAFLDLCDELAALGFATAIFDLGPGMSQLERCALMAAEQAVTPLTPEYFSVDGVAIFTNELEKLNKANQRVAHVKHTTIVANAVNRSFNRHRSLLQEFERLDYNLYTVPQDAKLAESQLAHQSVWEYAPEARSIPELERLTEGLWQ